MARILATARTIAPMTDDERRSDLHLEVRLTPEQLAQLRPALLRARSTELGEVRRRHVRLTAGYGDDTNRQVMDDEGDRAQARHEALDALIDAVERARSEAAEAG
jgi:hypothetical protein